MIWDIWVRWSSEYYCNPNMRRWWSECYCVLLVIQQYMLLGWRIQDNAGVCYDPALYLVFEYLMNIQGYVIIALSIFSTVCCLTVLLSCITLFLVFELLEWYNVLLSYCHIVRIRVHSVIPLMDENTIIGRYCIIRPYCLVILLPY